MDQIQATIIAINSMKSVISNLEIMKKNLVEGSLLFRGTEVRLKESKQVLLSLESDLELLRCGFE